MSFEKVNSITLKSINELLEFKFSIPSFQRGYRWKYTQVKDLLDDIWEFAQKKGKPADEFYCLQPIVVTFKDEKYSVIDGQQRLTTIYLILHFLDSILKIMGKSKYTLSYDTRKDEEFLLNIQKTKANENIDYFHICEALDTIEAWFRGKDGTVKLDFLNTLLRVTGQGNNVQVIWYEVNEEVNPIDIFTRLNMGKIQLTNAELIKALFLLEDNFEGPPKAKYLRQIEIAGEWDRMEYELRNDEFWYFLNDGDIEYDNRIEFIFDLMANKNGNDKDFTFRFFNDQFNRSKNVDSTWQVIKNYFLTFSEWYADRELYHLIGYLITWNTDIKKLKDECEGKTKKDFKQYLIDRIKLLVKCQVAELSYSEYSERDKIRKILLLFNIVTLLSNKKSNSRFQFERFKQEAWDLEHIHAVQSEMPTTLKDQQAWLNEVLKFTNNNEIGQRINSFLKENYLNPETFESLYSGIVRMYSVDSLTEDINDISNLTLLDVGTNRGYKNAIFPIKRKKIISKDENGTFIPLCTKNVFLKYYSESVDQMITWGKSDRDFYKSAIITTLEPYLPSQNIQTNEQS